MRAAVRAYLDRLDGAGLPDANSPGGNASAGAVAPRAARLAGRLLQHDDDDKQGKERGGGSGVPAGAGRRSSQFAGALGLAAAAAYAYKTGDAHTLERLRASRGAALGAEDEFELLRQIVDMASGPPDSTVEGEELRLVAADVGDWVLGAG